MPYSWARATPATAHVDGTIPEQSGASLSCRSAQGRGGVLTERSIDEHVVLRNALSQDDMFALRPDAKLVPNDLESLIQRAQGQEEKPDNGLGALCKGCG